jgi:predicted ATPase
MLAKALAVAHHNAERHYEAELYRLKGELLLRQGTINPCMHKATLHTEAETCFHQALEVARRQHAKSLELRAAMSLSRLRQTQGKNAEARQMLAEIYAWFTEGFDTPDLQEAKTLLEVWA